MKKKNEKTILYLMTVLAVLGGIAYIYVEASKTPTQITSEFIKLRKS